MQDGENCIGTRERQNEKHNAERVERGVLPGGEKGLPGEDVRIPERNLTRAERLVDKIFPRVIFEDQIIEERVVRLRYAILLRRTRSTEENDRGCRTAPVSCCQTTRVQKTERRARGKKEAQRNQIVSRCHSICASTRCDAMLIGVFPKFRVDGRPSRLLRRDRSASEFPRHAKPLPI